MMRDRTVVVPASLIVTTIVALTVFYVAFDREWIPLGIPNEWIWPTPDVWGLGTAEWVLFLPAAISLALLIAWVCWAARWVEHCRPSRFVAAIAGSIVLASSFQHFCEVAAPTGLQKWAMLYSYSANGFHAVAQQHSGDLGNLLENHADLIRDFKPHHFSANPPGWVVVYAGLTNFYRGHPGLAHFVWDIFAPMEMPWRLRGMTGSKGLPLEVHAALTTIAGLSRLLCFAGAIPAAWLALARAGRMAALAAASAVLLLPMEPLLAPHRDTVYPTVALLVLGLSHAAWQHRRWPLAAVAGITLGVGTFFSTCFFIIGGLAALYVAGLSLSGKRPTLASVIAAPLGWLAVVGMVHLAGHNSWATWSVNFAKNLEFNQLYRQSYAAWTLVNLVEFSIAIGLPLLIFLAGRIATIRRADALLCAWLAILAFLDLAGTNRGETYRLWLFMMPVGALLAVEWLPTLGRWFRPTLAAFLVLQALHCVIVDRDLLLFTDLEQTKARQESGISKIQRVEGGFEHTTTPAAELIERPEKKAEEP